MYKTSQTHSYSAKSKLDVKPADLFQAGAEAIMTTDNLAALKAEITMDARGTACLGTLLEARHAISECPVGGVMEIQSSDLDLVVSVQRWCNKMEFEYLGDIENV